MHTETLQSRAARLVQNEVHLCLSSIVSTLANGAYALPSKRVGLTDGADELGALAEQAAELCYPIDDWEEAAREAGFDRSDAGHLIRYPTDRDAETADTWQEACEIADVEPYRREVFEHWAVSTWLAEKLLEKGEKVDTDFGNLNVWARTTTGQAISIDAVIEEITRELHA